LPPRGASKADWKIVCDVARGLGGWGFDFAGPEAIWDEVRTLCAGARGMTYARLDAGGLQWPCPAPEHPGTPILHAGAFANGARAALQIVPYRSAPELIAADRPFQLITGRSLYQFNAGTMTGRTRNNELRPTDVLDISPDDAGRAGVGDGDRIRVSSRYGSAVLAAHVNPAVQSGQLFATFHSPAIRLNAVTGDRRDPTTGTPEYKVTAVRIERVRD
jgi:formate dehydrogenase major subunit